ncbi:hypothetical protein, partial [Hydrogenophaga sp.]|uniref:hypothetical protein n=1 Tax=Hydrogenophaga sp. TaxID=1904254 RepID=UPI002FC8B94F
RLTLPRCRGKQCSMRENCSGVISMAPVSWKSADLGISVNTPWTLRLPLKAMRVQRPCAGDRGQFIHAIRGPGKAAFCSANWLNPMAIKRATKPKIGQNIKSHTICIFK